MDRDGPGIVLLDYELITAEDASERAEGWKNLGIKYIERANWEEVDLLSARVESRVSGGYFRRMVLVLEQRCDRPSSRACLRVCVCACTRTLIL